MSVIDDFKSDKNINLIFNAASKMIKDKYSNVDTHDNDLINIIKSIILSICSDAILIKKIVKLMELNKIALSKIKEHYDGIINMQNEPEIIKTEEKDESMKYDSEQLLLKVLELEEKRSVANSLANLQKQQSEVKEPKQESFVQQSNPINFNVKILEKLEVLSREKTKISYKNIVINSYNRDWCNNPNRNKLSFTINIDLLKNNIKIDRLLLPKLIKYKTSFVTMTINNNKHAQKIIFVLKTSSNENAWDIWENVNSDNILLITNKNWHISFTDFLNNDLDMGQDNIDIIEVNDNLNNIYDLTIDNGDKMKYDGFGVSLINKYDNILIKTNLGDNIQGKVLHINDNILSVYIENIEKKILMNSSLLNYKGQYTIMMSYCQKL
tara:strand:- start:585 stop:1730 length:1146 start_codon:yes stop_codon:yes gene_type:complete